MNYETFIGVRYLMAKKSKDALSVITLISVAGVTVGVMAMIVVLSVMGGFEGDLKKKILGTRTHMVISGVDEKRVENPEKIVEALGKVEGVAGVSPFVAGELMISSPSNNSGVMLKGIDPARVGRVSDLERNLVDGSLSYLAEPEQVRPGRRGLSDPDELDKILDELEAEHGIDDGSGGKYVPGIEGKVYKTASGGTVIDQGAREDFRNRFIQSDPIIAGSGGDTVKALNKKEKAKNKPYYGDHPPEGYMPSLPGQSAGKPVLAASGQKNGEKKDIYYGDTPPEGYMPPLPGQGAKTPKEEAAVASPKRLPGLIIGRELKKSLQVDIGSEVNLVTPEGDIGPSGPIPRSRPFKVVGVFYSGMYEYDTKFVYTSLRSAQDFLSYEKGAVTGIEVKTQDVDYVTETRDEARETLEKEGLAEGLLVRDWKDMNSSLFFALKLEKVVMFIILGFIILVASFSIVCTLIMIVIEKAREVAILKSMGATDRSVMQIFITEGTIIGILGTTLGTILGVLCCLLVEFVGISLDPDVYYISHLPVEMDLTEIVVIIVSSLALSSLATVYPAIQAARLTPVEGLRYE